MSTYSNRLQPALQNLLQRVVWFFQPRSSCTTTHISADVERITLNASCMTISGERTEQLDIFYHVTGFTSDFLSFIDVELIRFLHGAIQLLSQSVYTMLLSVCVCMYVAVLKVIRLMKQMQIMSQQAFITMTIVMMMMMMEMEMEMLTLMRTCR